MHILERRALETIDAGVYSGDSFRNDKDAATLRIYVEKWRRWLDRYAEEQACHDGEKT